MPTFSVSKTLLNRLLAGPTVALWITGIALLGIGCNVVPTYTPPGQETSAAQPPAAAPANVPAVDPATGAPGPSDPLLTLTGEVNRLDRIQEGEKLTIVFSDVPAPGLPAHEVTVSSDGTISLPFNQSMKAAGKPKHQVQQEIRAIYVPGYYKQMSVTIRTDDRFFTVGGEVRNPSRQLFVGTMTVLKAVAAVGGFTEFARKGQVAITRQNGQKEIIDAVKAQENPQQFDVPVYPGDHIHVPRRVF